MTERTKPVRELLAIADDAVIEAAAAVALDTDINTIRLKTQLLLSKASDALTVARRELAYATSDAVATLDRL